ncbi:oligosaccharide flippase family protein [Candidatus Nomurabacteria bacterium]|nr:oligosaccharide flippase family protein [Candidatus Nomurabacteria bacterium]
MLNKIETFLSDKFKFDAKYTLRGGFWLLFGHLFTILAVLSTSYAFANYLDPLVYGNYRYLVTGSVIISLFSLSGLGSAITQATAKNLLGFFGQAIQLSTKYGLITSVVGLIGAAYYFFNGNELLAIGMVLIAIFQPFINTTTLIFPYFFGKQQFNVSTHWHAFKTLVTTVSIVSATLFTDSVLIIFLSFLLSNLLANTVVYHLNKPKKEDIIDKETSERFISYAKHTSYQNILLGFAGQLDKILVFQFLGAKELAIYAFATALPDQYKGITKTIDSLILPRFSNRKLNSIRSTILHKSLIYFSFLAVCALAYYLAAPLIFAVLYPSYSESVLLSQIYVLGIMTGIGSIPINALKAQLKNRLLYKFQVTSAIFQISSLLLLLPFYGMIGLVTARVVHRIFVCVISYALFFHTTRQTTC